MSYFYPLVETIKKALDTLKPTRSTPTQDKSAVSIPAGGTENIDKSGLDSYSAIAVTVRATFASGASKGIRIRWLYSPDSSNYDDATSADVEGNYSDLGYDRTGAFVGAGKAMQKTVLVPIFAPYVRIQLENLDSANAVTVDVWTTPLR